MKEKRVRIFLLHRRVLAVLCTLAVAAGKALVCPECGEKIR